MDLRDLEARIREQMKEMPRYSCSWCDRGYESQSPEAVWVTEDDIHSFCSRQCMIAYIKDVAVQGDTEAKEWLRREGLVEQSSTQLDYREHISSCMTKLGKDIPPKERMSICAQEWQDGKGKGTRERSEKKNDAHPKEEGVMKIYLLTSDDCEACDYVKRTFADDIEQGLIIPLSIERDEMARVLLESLNIEMVPQMVVEKPDGSYCLAKGPDKFVGCTIL